MHDIQSIISELKMLRAHASETEKWADKIISKLEAENAPVKKKRGLSQEELDRIEARFDAKIMKKCGK